MKKENEPVCCPPFDPTLWDDQIFMWENKLFIKEKVCTFLYMPINFGSAMRRADRLLAQSGSQLSDALCLSDHTSKWNMDVFLSVDKEIPGADNIKISGSFFCKVYEGPFKDTGKWCSDFDAIAKEKGLTVKKMYMWYTTCPKCAKKYGKNYVAIFGQID